jgi:hypothetical protein
MMKEPQPLPRFVPDVPLPPYSYVPGQSPHPLSDARGHSFGVTPERPAAPDPDHWQDCRSYLRGVDLFNHGYYWEAHEVWEGLWHACGRTGQTACFLKGLIKLAAAGVKTREGRPQGVQSHARRATELFQQTAREIGGENPVYMGLRVDELVRFASDLVDHPTATRTGKGVAGVFDFVVWPA